jgi:hypothetical protein
MRDYMMLNFKSSGRMLKKPASVVLASKASSTYPEGTPPVLSSAAALLDRHFEHLARLFYIGYSSLGGLLSGCDGSGSPVYFGCFEGRAVQWS